MGNPKRKKRTTHRSQPYEDSSIVEDEDCLGEKEATEMKGVESAEVLLSLSNDASAPDVSQHSIFKRHAAEWKAMKAIVAKLKRERKKLRKNVIAEKERKKDIGKRIKTLVLTLRNDQIAEQKAAGISSSTGAGLGAEGDALLMDLDETQ